MLIIAGSLATFVFGTGMRVLEMCQEAKQCQVEVARIAVRTQNVLGTLKNAGEHFSDEAQLETSLLELKGVFEILQSLVGRCGLPTSFSKRASTAMLKRKNPNKQALADAEARLEQITKVKETIHSSARINRENNVFIVNPSANNRCPT